MVQLSLILVAVVGALGFVAAAFVAAKRQTKQPVPENPEAEKLLVSAVCEKPHLAMVYFFSQQLKPSEFAHPERAELYALAMASMGRPLEIPSRLRSQLASCRSFAKNTPTPKRWTKEEELQLAAEEVHVLCEDRTMYAGANPLELTENDPAMQRVYKSPSKRRLTLSAVLGALSFVVASVYAWRFFDRHPVSSRPLAVGILLLLLLVGWVIALVDFDTLFVDLPTLFAGGFVCWALTLVVLVSSSSLSAAVPGLLATLAWVGAFELSSFIYKLLRGVPGMGSGDGFITLVTTGVPASLTGSWELGFWSVLAAMILSLCVQLPRWMMNRSAKREPFALGPYLAFGWLVAFAALSGSVM